MGALKLLCPILWKHCHFEFHFCNWEVATWEKLFSVTLILFLVCRFLPEKREENLSGLVPQHCHLIPVSVTSPPWHKGELSWNPSQGLDISEVKNANISFCSGLRQVFSVVSGQKPSFRDGSMRLLCSSEAAFIRLCGTKHGMPGRCCKPAPKLVVMEQNAREYLWVCPAFRSTVKSLKGDRSHRRKIFVSCKHSGGWNQFSKQAALSY